MKSKSKHIVFVNQSANYLMVDIINAHIENGHNCTLITGEPKGSLTKLRNDVQIKKIIRYNRTNLLTRAFTWLWAFLQSVVIIKLKYKKSYLFLVSNPPLNVFIPIFCSNEYSFLVYDVYPDALVNQNLLTTNSLFVSGWKKLNKKTFGNAENLYTLSKGMSDVLSNYLSQSKIKIVPIWASAEIIPIPKICNDFIKREDIADKFIVLYSGNLGLSHNIEFILEVAKETKDKDILFLIIGEGAKKKKLLDTIEDYELVNCRILNWQPEEILSQTLSSADIGIVSLNSNFEALSVPSKTFNLISVGVPLLCVASQESELAKLVKKYENGMCFNSSDRKKMVEYIMQHKSNKAYHGAMRKRSMLAAKDFTNKNAQMFL